MTQSNTTPLSPAAVALLDAIARWITLQGEKQSQATAPDPKPAAQ